jgi:hypothetical protein
MRKDIKHTTYVVSLRSSNMFNLFNLFRGWLVSQTEFRFSRNSFPVIVVGKIFSFYRDLKNKLETVGVFHCSGCACMGYSRVLTAVLRGSQYDVPHRS